MHNETHFQFVASSVALCLTLIGLAGCTTTPGQDGPADAALAVAEAWQTALADRDFDAALRLVADDFYSERWPEKADLAYYFRQADQRDYFADAKIPNEEMKAQLDGDEAVVYPVPIRAKLGVAVYRLDLERRENGWTVVSAVQELY